MGRISMWREILVSWFLLKQILTPMNGIGRIWSASHFLPHKKIRTFRLGYRFCAQTHTHTRGRSCESTIYHSRLFQEHNGHGWLLLPAKPKKTSYTRESIYCYKDTRLCCRSRIESFYRSGLWQWRIEVFRPSTSTCCRKTTPEN